MIAGLSPDTGPQERAPVSGLFDSGCQAASLTQEAEPTSNSHHGEKRTVRDRKLMFGDLQKVMH